MTITYSLHLKRLYSLREDNHTENLSVGFSEVLILELKGAIKTSCMFYSGNRKKLTHLRLTVPSHGLKVFCINFTTLGRLRTMRVSTAEYSSTHTVHELGSVTPKLQLVFSRVLHSFLIHTSQMTACCRTQKLKFL